MTISKIGYLPTMKDIYSKFGKKLIFATYNLCQSKTEYLSHETYPDLPCITALHMTANLPLIFEKFLYNGSYYIDGGLADNFPIDLADEQCQKIFGILLDNEFEKIKITRQLHTGYTDPLHFNGYFLNRDDSKMSGCIHFYVENDVIKKLSMIMEIF